MFYFNKNIDSFKEFKELLYKNNICIFNEEIFINLWKKYNLNNKKLAIINNTGICSIDNKIKKEILSDFLVYIAQQGRKSGTYFYKVESGFKKEEISSLFYDLVTYFGLSKVVFDNIIVNIRMKKFNESYDYEFF